MKKITRYLYCTIAAPALLLLLSGPAAAQTGKTPKGKKAKTEAQKVHTVRVRTEVVGTDGKPIKSAVVYHGEGTPAVRVNGEGIAVFHTTTDTHVIVEAPGYNPRTFTLSAAEFPAKVVLEKALPFSTVSDRIYRTDNGSTTRHDLTGAAGTITGQSLTSYPDLMLGNALQGREAGLLVSPTLGKVGNNGPSLFLRGQHAKSGNQAMVMIDGVERPLNELIAEEIETIQFLKDPTTKILYGPRAANGVVQVTTRRGEAVRRTISISAEAGVSQLTRLPEYIDSYEYANLYNEASLNDGLPAFYTPEQIEGYRNSTGRDDLLYPNADYYKEFLKKQALFRKATMEVIGGNSRIRYALILGYTGSGGFEKVGKSPNFDRLNIRGRVDVEVSRFLSVAAGIGSRFDITNWGSQTPADYFPLLGTHRPNEYPFTIDPATIGRVADESGMPVFGASLSKPNNLYADMMYGGFSQERNLNSQADLGLKLNLDKLTKGLSAAAGVSFDNYNYFMNGQRNVQATYDVRPYTGPDGEQQLLVSQMRKYSKQGDQSRLGEKTLRTIAWNANAAYQHTFGGAHDLSAVLAYRYWKNEVKGKNLDEINSNTTLRLNYGYDNRLLAEATLAGMGSNRFAPGNRMFFSPAAGVAWVLSNESFLKGSQGVNFLKLKASFGILGYDGTTGTPNHATAWENGGSFLLGEQNKTPDKIITNFLRAGSPDLKWEHSTEWNAGIEGAFLRDRLFAEINYFHEKRSDIIGFKGSDYGDYLGAFHGVTNMGSVMNQGVEATLRWGDRAGDFGYSVGVNGIWSKNKLLAWNQIDHPDAYLQTVGKPTDAMMGYRALGLFGRDIALAGHPNQYLGDYQTGDIAYADLNRDGKVDDLDREMVGNSFPRMTMGIELNLTYKRWGLYVLGVAETGVDVWTTNNYYWNRQEDKYSTVVRDRFHPVSNPGGTYPRLTTYSGLNNFQNSSFWVENADFFRLKNVELSYTWNNPKSTAVCNRVKVFVRGTNLFVLSGIKDLDPELINAGVNNYPQIRTITAGVAVKF